MAAPNEVRVNIRHNVLLLKTFTVPKLRAVTGLNRQSIYTEIRRMEQEGLVSRVGIEERKKETAGGRPPVIYQLTSDPEKRFEVLQSVRAFYIAEEEGTPELPRPESKHYFIAKEMLEEITEKRVALTQGEKAKRLDMIKKRLEYARREEEVGEEGTQLIAASFDILEAKAIDALAGDWERAVVMLDEARRACQQLGATELVAEVKAYVQTMVTHMANDQLKFDESREYAKVREIAHDLRIIKHRFGDLPEISTSIKQAERLAEKAEQQRISLAEERAAQQTQINEDLKQILRDLTGKRPEVAEAEYERVSELGFGLRGQTERTGFAAFERTPAYLRYLLQEEEQQPYGPN